MTNKVVLIVDRAISERFSKMGLDIKKPPYWAVLKI